LKEITFLKQNADKWQEFENMLNSSHHSNPDSMADLFIQLTDDLSYSKTKYPKSKTTQYLNSLAARVHQEIYKNKKEKKGRIITFWKYELPFLFKNSHKQLLYSFIIFFIAVLIGIVSAAYDDTFVRLILGDSYVNMTLENIENNDPMAVYKSMNQVDMFLAITVNNIKVSFVCFALGILFSLGTGWALLQNGIMLGAFQYFFYEKGLLLDSVLVIWIHGTLEISAIIIAGCAGLTLGNGILYPGTYSRGVSFVRAAKQSVKIVVGLVPIFIIAGFLESFVTRYTNMPMWLSLTIIETSLIFIIWYFVLYPIKLNQKESFLLKELYQRNPILSFLILIPAILMLNCAFLKFLNHNTAFFIFLIATIPFIINSIWHYLSPLIRINNDIIQINKALFVKRKILMADIEKVNFSNKQYIEIFIRNKPSIRISLFSIAKADRINLKKTLEMFNHSEIKI